MRFSPSFETASYQGYNEIEQQIYQNYKAAEESCEEDQLKILDEPWEGQQDDKRKQEWRVKRRKKLLKWRVSQFRGQQKNSIGNKKQLPKNRKRMKYWCSTKEQKWIVINCSINIVPESGVINEDKVTRRKEWYSAIAKNWNEWYSAR